MISKMLPSSPSIEPRSSWDGGRGGPVDSHSVGSVGHSVPPTIATIAEVRARVGPVAGIRIPSIAAIAKA